MKMKNLTVALAALGMVAAPVAANAADSAAKLSVAKSVRAPAAAGKSKALAGGGLIALLAAAAVVALVVVVASDDSDSN
ncbi:hypothetical protein [Sphingomonas sp. RS2018]